MTAAIRPFLLSLTTVFTLGLTLTSLPVQAKEEAAPAKTAAKSGDKKMSNPIVIMETSVGKPIEIELFADKAPISVENFLKYVDEGFYSGTIFHRVIKGFMIQGGGMDEKLNQKANKAQIKNEANNGVKNDKYTLAMARTNVVDSATSQFFINAKDNDFLNYTSPSNYGYAVFGKVINDEGKHTVEEIEKVSTTTKGMNENVPVTPILIKSIKRK